MLGKTNVLFISRSDAMESQLVYEKHLTQTTGTIRKIECMNNMLFAYTSDKAVMCGPAVDSLEFIKKDGKNLVATHFIFCEGKYYFCNAYQGNQEKGVVYATEDFLNYEEIVIEEDVYIGSNKKALFSIPGIFKDSKERIVVMVREINTVGSGTYKLNLHIFNSFEELSGKNVITCNYEQIADLKPEDIVLVKDRILAEQSNTYLKYICDLYGNVKRVDNFGVYASDYFFRCTYKDSTAYGKQIVNIYRSFNVVDWSKCTGFNIDNAYVWNSSADRRDIFSIGRSTCLLYRSGEKIYLNIADKVDKIGDQSNPTFEFDISEFDDINAIAEDNEGNTYIGFTGGMIVKLWIDQDGSTQQPDVTLIKTLAAKEALAQAKQYTDKKVAELKAYFDGSMGQQ